MSVQACAELVRRGDPDRFLSAMTAPPEARARLFPLYAFNVEVARAPWVTTEDMIAEMRLQWWRDAVEEVGAGKPPRAHEVVGPLARVIAECDLPVALFDQLISARRWDIYSDPFQDQGHFADHIDRTSGHLMWLAAMTFGAPDALEGPVRDAAHAAGVANWLVAVAELEARGKVALLDGRAAGIRALADEALERLKRARRTDFGAATPAVRAGWRAKVLLKKALRDPGQVADGALGTSDFRRRASLLFKTAVGGW